MPADEPLYLDDKTIAKKIGLKPEMAKSVFMVWERSGFPRPDPMVSDKRYWPAIRAFLDRREGVSRDQPLSWEEREADRRRDIAKENWGAPSPRQRVRQERLEREKRERDKKAKT